MDNIILEECNDCDLVKYCSDKCREEHREQHEEECKKRQAELRDKKLFTQPDETHRGECPICFLPMPLDPEKYTFWSCCSNFICDGCIYANCASNIHCMMGAPSCPFCREPMSSEEEESHRRMMKRVKANDPVAMSQMGRKYYEGGNYKAAFNYLTKAAELGNFHAHYILGIMYWKGKGVEKDEEKAVYHWEKAAIGGHPEARHNLGCIEEENGSMKRAVKHYIIAANLGFENSMKTLWGHYSDGDIAKEELEAALRTNKAAIDATKSPQRKIADEIRAK